MGALAGVFLAAGVRAALQAVGLACAQFGLGCVWQGFGEFAIGCGNDFVAHGGS